MPTFLQLAQQHPLYPQFQHDLHVLFSSFSSKFSFLAGISSGVSVSLATWIRSGSRVINNQRHSPLGVPISPVSFDPPILSTSKSLQPVRSPVNPFLFLSKPLLHLSLYLPKQLSFLRFSSFSSFRAFQSATMDSHNISLFSVRHLLRSATASLITQSRQHTSSGILIGENAARSISSVFKELNLISSSFFVEPVRFVSSSFVTKSSTTSVPTVLGKSFVDIKSDKGRHRLEFFSALQPSQSGDLYSFVLSDCLINKT
ncbi:hypothetical protein GEMRC1_004019 [Eukaryota sp. GEM-RC1]